LGAITLGGAGPFEIHTPFEGADTYLYVFWTDEVLTTKFSGFDGTTTTQIFTASYNWDTDVWTARGNGSTHVFTPDSSDVLFAIGEVKNNKIDWLRSLITANGPIRADVNFLRTALVDDDGTVAGMLLDTSAGTANAFLRLQAINNAGVVDSDVGIGGARVAVYHPVADEYEIGLESVAGFVKVNGSLSATSGIFIGEGSDRWGVALAPKQYSVTDGDVISFGLDFGAAAQVLFSTSGLDDLASGETYRLRAISSTGTGFTVELKIVTNGASTTTTENTVVTTPAGPDKMLAKVETDDAYNDVYTFKFSGSITVTAFTIGGVTTYASNLAINTYFHNGSIWLNGQAITLSHTQLGITPSHTSGTQSFTFTDATDDVLYTGVIRDSATLGTFGLTAVSGGLMTALTDVVYLKASITGPRTATPDGQSIIATVTPVLG
jgi:hypothetical protein